MPANTPIYNFPYPLGTDPVAQGDNDIRALAEDVETVIDGLENTVYALPAGRNLLYNGAMQVHQRGTSRTAITSGDYYTADRWKTTNISAGTWTQTVENDAPTGSGFAKSLKMLCTTADSSLAAGDELDIRQILEGQDLQGIKKGTASAEPLTISFWVKSNVVGTYVCWLFDSDNSRFVGATYSVASSGTWEQKKITFPADTTGVFTNDNNASLSVGFQLAAGSNFTSGTLPSSWASYVAANQAVGQVNLAGAVNNYWQVTGVQLVIGAEERAFQFKSIEQEQSECERYYQIAIGSATSFTITGYGYANSIGTAETATFNLTTTMRTPPTIGVFGAAQAFDGSVQRTITAITSTKSTTRIASGDPSYGGGTFNALRTVWYFSSALTGYNYFFSAEL